VTARDLRNGACSGHNRFGKQPSMAPDAGPAILGRSRGRARDATGIA
jgi:hypothetical protein